MPPTLISTMFSNVTFLNDLDDLSIPEGNNSWTSVAVGNSTVAVITKSSDREMTWDDATWILTSSFIIFTMQSGKFIYQEHLPAKKNVKSS